MVHLADLFSVPEMGLLCNVAEYFIRNHIDYHPEILFLDVKVGYSKTNNNYIELLQQKCVLSLYQMRLFHFFLFINKVSIPAISVFILKQLLL